MCPRLPPDLNCTQECLADQDCPENLKCCWASKCASACSIPNGKARRSRAWSAVRGPRGRERLHHSEGNKGGAEAQSLVEGGPQPLHEQDELPGAGNLGTRDCCFFPRPRWSLRGRGGIRWSLRGW